MKLKNGALAYHLKTLEREDLIKSQTDGKFKRFYPYEMNVPNRATKLTTMRKNIVERIKEEMKRLEIKNNAQFLFKLRYPSDAMVKLNENLFSSFKNAGFEFFLKWMFWQDE